MKYVLLIILLCVTSASISFANQEIKSNIEAVNIDGVNITTKMIDVGGILIKSGYLKNEAGTRLPYLLHYDKGDCRIQISGEKNIESITYACKGSEGSALVNKYFLIFCAIDNNGIGKRKGCIEKFPFPNEGFETQGFDGEGKKYLIRLNLNRMHNKDGSITIQVKHGKPSIKKTVSVNPKFKSTVTGASNEQITEVNTFYHKCENGLHRGLSHTHDCVCFANELLKEWQIAGYQNKIDVVKAHVMRKGICRAVTKKGYDYEHEICMSRFGKNNSAKMTTEDYCKCYTDKWAELVDNFKGKLQNMQDLKSQSRAFCFDLGRAQAK